MDEQIRTDVTAMDASGCGACGSLVLVETMMHDGSSWTHHLVCRDCQHVLESASYLSHEPPSGA